LRKYREISHLCPDSKRLPSTSWSVRGFAFTGRTLREYRDISDLYQAVKRLTAVKWSVHHVVPQASGTENPIFRGPENSGHRRHGHQVRRGGTGAGA
jgi:hypothetical protein